MDWVIASLIIAVGFMLAVERSSWIIDYAIFVFVFNRGIRRVIDWYAGEFNPFSPISLTPLVVACFAAIPIITAVTTVPHRIGRILACFYLAIGYAFIVGFVRWRFGAVYALAEYLAPVSLLSYAALSRPSGEIIDRWIRSIAWCAIGASAYGWYQYLTIPPWDALWVISVGFEGYLGVLARSEITVFSTMAERGPLALYLGLALVPMIVSIRWRTIFGWPAIILIASTILLTMSRAGAVIAVMTSLIYVAINRGAGLKSVLVASIVLVLAAFYGMGKMPGAERIQTRFESLGAMHEDGSTLNRVDLMRHGWRSVLQNPLGSGLGATGVSSRVGLGSMDELGIGENGYLALLTTFGWFGGFFFIKGLWGIWQESRLWNGRGRSDVVLLARSLLLASIPTMLAGNFLPGISLFWLALGCALSGQVVLSRRRQGRSVATKLSPESGLATIPTKTT